MANTCQVFFNFFSKASASEGHDKTQRITHPMLNLAHSRVEAGPSHTNIKGEALDDFRVKNPDYKRESHKKCRARMGIPKKTRGNSEIESVIIDIGGFYE